MKRYFLGLALALLAIPGVSRADIVTLSNSAGSSQTTNTSLFIRFSTTASSNQLTSLTLFNGPGSADAVAYTLKDSSGSTVNSISNSSQSFDSSGLLTFSGAGLNSFGAGTYWLEVTGLQGYKQGASATLSSDNPLISNGLMDTGVNNNTGASGVNLFQVSFQVTAVPEPATLILTGSVLAVGFGASVVRRLRKKSEGEIAA